MSGVIHPWDNFPGVQFSSEPVVRGAIMQATNHPKGNFLWGQLSRGKLSGVNYFRGNRPRANYLGAIVRGAIIPKAIVRGAIIRVAIFLGGNCPGGNNPEGNHPGGNFPRGQLSGHPFFYALSNFNASTFA